MGKWILEDRLKDKDFCYRLIEKDFRVILYGFMFLVDVIKGDSENFKLFMKFMFIVFIVIKLRDCVLRFFMYYIIFLVV